MMEKINKINRPTLPCQPCQVKTTIDETPNRWEGVPKNLLGFVTRVVNDPDLSKFQKINYLYSLSPNFFHFEIIGQMLEISYEQVRLIYFRKYKSE